MTTWPCPLLAPGTYGLPEPAILLAPWVFEVHVTDPDAGFTRIHPEVGWDGVGRAHPEIALDVHHPRSALLLRAGDPAAVDADALHGLRAEAFERGAVAWMTPLPLRPDAPGAAQALEAAHARTRIWVLTGDLPTYWRALDHQPGPPAVPELPAGELFPGGTWAASVALLAQPDEHGVGTRRSPT